jgi:tetraacyldisaccharide 4'-kinase
MPIQTWLQRGMDWVVSCHSQTSPPPGWWVALSALPRWVYGALVIVRHALYRWEILPVTCLPVPVVSVGNLTTGGTGKTPIVIALAQRWVAQGKHVVVLSRGYGARRPQAYARATDPDFGDEPYLIQQTVPQAVVIVGANRRANALRALTEFRPDVVILDDGFQYRGLARTADIVLVDGVTGLGNGALLPTGPLREPLGGLQRAQCVWVTRWQGSSEALKAQAYRWGLLDGVPSLQNTLTGLPLAAVGLALLQPGGHPVPDLFSVDKLLGQSVITISGIARPQTFEASVVESGATIVAKQAFADHHEYTATDFNTLIELAHQWPDAWIITTAKDVVKWTSDVFPPSLVSRVRVLMIAPAIPETALAQIERLIGWPH